MRKETSLVGMLNEFQNLFRCSKCGISYSGVNSSKCDVALHGREDVMSLAILYNELCGYIEQQLSERHDLNEIIDSTSDNNNQKFFNDRNGSNCITTQYAINDDQINKKTTNYHDFLKLFLNNFAIYDVNNNDVTQLLLDRSLKGEKVVCYYTKTLNSDTDDSFYKEEHDHGLKEVNTEIETNNSFRSNIDQNNANDNSGSDVFVIEPENLLSLSRYDYETGEMKNNNIPTYIDSETRTEGVLTSTNRPTLAHALAHTNVPTSTSVSTNTNISMNGNTSTYTSISTNSNVYTDSNVCTNTNAPAHIIIPTQINAPTHTNVTTNTNAPVHTNISMNSNAPTYTNISMNSIAPTYTNVYTNSNVCTNTNLPTHTNVTKNTNTPAHTNLPTYNNGRANANIPGERKRHSSILPVPFDDEPLLKCNDDEKDKLSEKPKIRVENMEDNKILYTKNEVEMTPKYCVVKSRMSKREFKNLILFCKTFDILYKEELDNEVTHVIMYTSEDRVIKRSGYTFKYILALATKKQLVSHLWVTSSLLKKKLLNPNDFEVFAEGVSEDRDVPRTARTRTDNLLDGFAIVIYGSFDGSYLTQDQVKGLAMASGAKVETTLEVIPKIIESHTCVYVICNPELPPIDKRSAYSTCENSNLCLLSFEWLIESIVSQKIEEMEHYRIVL